MLKKDLEKIVGGLSKPSKMPGPAYNLPAYKCITGPEAGAGEGLSLFRLLRSEGTLQVQTR